ncbi:ATPase family associated with various cellular activities (AAA) [Streptomyces sp. DvalAA-14]|uniref:ATP-binding protein n=1 Tax=unclassified Streptomyces TaxID=2593676 RepID=UPI00081B791D|nr:MULTISPECIES: ATP-binding protein [unclassified Streptomyces]MYS22467.1 AAA family ATPase [Streptomyces sp. SID4948]SCE16855.1 ATPase family associated with various cellular activities (AAA) [Streptomyces sp. DvalAA-14]
MSPYAEPLLDRLDQLRYWVARLVEQRSADDPTADDPLRGLYLSEDAVWRLLRPVDDAAGADDQADQPGPEGDDAAPDGEDAGPEDDDALPDGEDAGPESDEAAREGDGAEPEGEYPAADDDRLYRLAVRLGLTALDVHLLLLALAPDLDRSFEPLYGYLNDDVSRRRATVGLALELSGLPPHSTEARARFHPSAPLSALGLLRVEESERPFLSRSLRVPDRVVAHLLGDDTQDSALDGYARPLRAPEARPQFDALTQRLAKRLAAGPLTVYLRQLREDDGLVCAAAALDAAGLEALHFTPAASAGPAVPATSGGPPAAGDPGSGEGDHDLMAELLREARLLGCAIVVAPLPERPGPLVRALSVPDVPVLMVGSGPYDPDWCDRHREPLVLDAPRQRSGDLDTWSAAIGTALEPGFDLAPVVAPYRLGGERIRRAARAARELAAFDGSPLSGAHLRLAARQQSASGLEQHARRISPAVTWDDLVLPDKPLAHLHELALRARHRDQVLGDWRLSAGGGRGRGVLALFAGESGTGKTLSAEVVAAELGLDLYVVQLSSIVDKYVGETEKNLERIFTEADRTDAVLLFDEADAVFGKRSEVKDSHDRYANLESAYLLQRLESFDGIALLTTNLRANIDDAFTRRLDLVVDFPFPDSVQRLALWRHSLASVPCVPGIDPEPCARDFELAGGSIRSAVVTAAYAAAGRGDPVTGADLLAGAQREYRKAGRLVLDDGGW